MNIKDKVWHLQHKFKVIFLGKKKKEWLQRDWWLLITLLSIIAFGTMWDIASDVYNTGKALING